MKYGSKQAGHSRPIPRSVNSIFPEHGEQSFRATSVSMAVKSVQSFDQMTNLSKSTRALLDAHFEFNLLKVDFMQRSKDAQLRMQSSYMMVHWLNQF